jgi:murein DD-endopeptidase MepM/ murein hydrolase activator NlpD
MAKLTPEQRYVLSVILKQARKAHATPKEVKAAIETGIVESNLTNPQGGTGDSAGWRQERRSLYPDPTNVADAAARFFRETRQLRGRYANAGDLAAAVQRPAAQYRGRYQQHSGEAQALLQGYGLSGTGGQPSSRGGGSGGGGYTTTTTTTTPGVDNSALRQQIVLNYLQQGGVKNPSALLPFIGGITQAQDIAPSSSTRTSSSSGGGSSTASGPGKRYDVKPGVPVARLTSEGGLHPTAGLAGFPAHDYMAPAGSAAVAPVSGKVVRLSGHDPRQGPTQGPHGPLGWSVYIRGDDGRTYYLTHMGSRTVRPGQRVRQGQRIGTVADYHKYGTPDHIHMGVSG